MALTCFIRAVLALCLQPAHCTRGDQFYYGHDILSQQIGQIAIGVSCGGHVTLNWVVVCLFVVKNAQSRDSLYIVCLARWDGHETLPIVNCTVIVHHTPSVPLSLPVAMAISGCVVPQSND